MDSTTAHRRLRTRGPRASLIPFMEQATNEAPGQIEVSLGRITEISQEIEEAESEVEGWQREIAECQREAERIMERVKEREELVKMRQHKIKQLTVEYVRLKRAAAELTGSRVGCLPLPPPVNYSEGSGSGGSGCSGSRNGSRRKGKKGHAYSNSNPDFNPNAIATANGDGDGDGDGDAAAEGQSASCCPSTFAGAVDLGACMCPRIVCELRCVENFRAILQVSGECYLSTVAKSLRRLRRRGCCRWPVRFALSEYFCRCCGPGGVHVPQNSV